MVCVMFCNVNYLGARVIEGGLVKLKLRLYKSNP